MPITLNCPCGKTLRVPDASAGKRARCPACQAVVTIPTAPPPEAEPVFEVVEEPTPAAAPSPAYKKPFADEDEEDDGGTYGLAKPDRDDPPPGGGKGGSGGSGGGGSAAGGKKLPNFRIGTDNHK